MVARQVDLLKAGGVTAMMTALGHSEEADTVGISSLVDTWLLVRNIESNGERNRLLFVLKSRGTAHSNQVREFVITDHGVELVDVYVGPAGILTGSARLVQEAHERDAEIGRAEELTRRRLELRRSVMEGEARLAALEDQLASERSEIERIDTGEARLRADAEGDRRALAARRWADAGPNNGGGPP